MPEQWRYSPFGPFGPLWMKQLRSSPMPVPAEPPYLPCGGLAGAVRMARIKAGGGGGGGGGRMATGGVGMGRFGEGLDEEGPVKNFGIV